MIFPSNPPLSSAIPQPCLIFVSLHDPGVLDSDQSSSAALGGEERPRRCPAAGVANVGLGSQILLRCGHGDDSPGGFAAWISGVWMEKCGKRWGKWVKT